MFPTSSVFIDFELFLRH